MSIWCDCSSFIYYWQHTVLLLHWFIKVTGCCFLRSHCDHPFLNRDLAKCTKLNSVLFPPPDLVSPKLQLDRASWGMKQSLTAPSSCSLYNYLASELLFPGTSFHSQTCALSIHVINRDKHQILRNYLSLTFGILNCWWLIAPEGHYDYFVFVCLFMIIILILWGNIWLVLKKRILAHIYADLWWKGVCSLSLKTAHMSQIPQVSLTHCWFSFEHRKA